MEAKDEIVIKLTAEDFEGAKRHHPGSCLIAKAIKRQLSSPNFKLTRVAVDLDEVTIKYKGQKEKKYWHNGEEIVLDFDNEELTSDTFAEGTEVVLEEQEPGEDFRDD